MPYLILKPSCPVLSTCGSKKAVREQLSQVAARWKGLCPVGVEPGHQAAINASTREGSWSLLPVVFHQEEKSGSTVSLALPCVLMLTQFNPTIKSSDYCMSSFPSLQTDWIALVYTIESSYMEYSHWILINKDAIFLQVVKAS